jgi:hypothetical protein
MLPAVVAPSHAAATRVESAASAEAAAPRMTLQQLKSIADELQRRAAALDKEEGVGSMD